MTAPIAISLCICTYNRADMLARTLPTFASLVQEPGGPALELILVDNNSSDGTRATFEAVRSRFSFPVRYVFEQRQGISHARNAAVAAASGAFVAFFDDECMVRPDWAVVAARTIAESGAAIIGGPHTAGFLDGRRPRWFKERYGDVYFLRRPWLKRGFTPGFLAIATNILVRRDVFDAVRFDPALGMSGRRVAMGEETALQRDWLARNPGSAIWYEPDLALVHLVRPEKMSLRYKLRRDYAMGVADAHRDAAAGAPPTVDPTRLRRDLIEVLLSPWLAWRRDRSRYPHWQNFYYEATLPGPIRRLARDRAVLRARRRMR